MVNKNHIKENLKFLRLKLSMTQGEFGGLFGVSRDNIASYERGSEPKLDFIDKIVNYFQISYDAFITTRLDGSAAEPSVENSSGLIGARGMTAYNEKSGRSSRVCESGEKYEAGASGEPGAKKTGWQNIPIYDIEPTTGLLSLFEGSELYEPIDYFAGSSLPRCDGGVRMIGDGMYPVVKPGDFVLYKQVTDFRNIFWGEMYLLSCQFEDEEYILVRYLQQSKLPDHVLLVSHNPDHAPKDIPLTTISALALVKMTIRVNTVK